MIFFPRVFSKICIYPCKYCCSKIIGIAFATVNIEKIIVVREYQNLALPLGNELDPKIIVVREYQNLTLPLRNELDPKTILVRESKNIELRNNRSPTR